jgi:multicomponent Na+:H+ antiporter subunit F
MSLLVGVLVVGAALAAALAFVRVVRGPTQADRIVAQDVLFAAGAAFCLAAALHTGRSEFFDVALLLGGVGFAAGVVWARLVGEAPRNGDAS